MRAGASAVLCLLIGLAGAGRYPSPTPPIKPVNIPILFEANEGQATPEVQFIARARGYTMLMNGSGAEFLAAAGSRRIRMQLVDAVSVPVEGFEPAHAQTTYITGRMPSDWRRGIRNFHRVAQRGIYPGIDLVYYARDGSIEYDFILAPGADPTRIRFTVEGADRTELEAGGDLTLTIGNDRLRWRSPAGIS
jgi:hypothetical protein